MRCVEDGEVAVREPRWMQAAHCDGLHLPSSQQGQERALLGSGRIGHKDAVVAEAGLGERLESEGFVGGGG